MPTYITYHILYWYCGHVYESACVESDTKPEEKHKNGGGTVEQSGGTLKKCDDLPGKKLGEIVIQNHGTLPVPCAACAWNAPDQSGNIAG